MIKDKINITKSVNEDTGITTIKGKLELTCAMNICREEIDIAKIDLLNQVEHIVKNEIVNTLFEEIKKEWQTLKVLLLQDQAKTRYDETYYSNLVKIGEQIRLVDEKIKGE